MKTCLVFIGLAINQIAHGTQLHYAVLVDDEKAAHQFLDQHPNLINAPDVAYGGWPALHYAAYFGSEKMVQLLVERGANAQLPDIHGKKAIDHARSQKREWIVSYLATIDVRRQIQALKTGHPD